MLFCFCGHSLQNFIKVTERKWFCWNERERYERYKGMNVEGIADLGKSQWNAIIVIDSKIK